MKMLLVFHQSLTDLDLMIAASVSDCIHVSGDIIRLFSCLVNGKFYLHKSRSSRIHRQRISHMPHKFPFRQTPCLTVPENQNSSKQIGIIAFRHFNSRMSISSNKEQQPDKPSRGTKQMSSNLFPHSSRLRRRSTTCAERWRG